MRKALVLLLLLSSFTAAEAATLRETVDRTFDVKPGSTFSLDNVNGGVTVRSWDQPRIRVVAEKEVEGSSAEAKEILAALRIDMAQSGDRVSVKTIVPKRNDGSGLLDFLFGSHIDVNVRYEVSVPREMRLELENTNGGVAVTGVNGMLSVTTTNGKISLSRCAGSVDAESTNGRIEAELLALNGQANTFETTNGRIQVTLPEGIKADVDASTTNGGVETELPITTRSVGRTHLRGTMNGGGVPLRLRTTNGSITIRQGAQTQSQASR